MVLVNIMNNKTTIFIGLLSLVCLSSCNTNNYSSGYETGWFQIDPYAIAFRCEKDRFKENEDVNLTISYGHYKNAVPSQVPENATPLPICLFLNIYHKPFEGVISDYHDFYDCILLEETPIDEFFTDDYIYTIDKRAINFNHNVSFSIPYDYFIKGEAEVFELLLIQFYQYPNDPWVDFSYCLGGSIYLFFDRLDEGSSIRINFL